MSAYSPLTRCALVRCSHSEETTFRVALGPLEPLHVFVTDGPLDAPTWQPAGAMQATNAGPRAQITSRCDS